MTIQEKFDSLAPYLRGIKRAENFSIVEMHLKTKWAVPNNDKIQNQNKPVDGDVNQKFYMFYSENSIDEVLEYLEENVINKNIEIEKKEDLLKRKITELKNIFQTNSLDELEQLKFIKENEDLLSLNGNGLKEPEPKEEKEPETIKED